MSDVMPAQAGTHAILRQLPPSGVGPRLRGDDEVWS
jgi:hypothetical protein